MTNIHTWWTAPPKTTTRPAAHVHTPVVTRRINAPLPRLARSLADTAVLATLGNAALVDAGRLTIEGLDPVPGRAWAGHGHVRSSTLRLFARTPITFEIRPWSADSSELTVRLSSRHVRWWGARRLRHHQHLAHLAADHVWRTLDRTAVAQPVAEGGHRAA